ncbi:MAG TPA: PH domain-containing protein [Glaciibacter sp.]|nr:PH domain-containing protein [Glaciibacter sp.]
MSNSAGWSPDPTADQPPPERVVARLRPHARVLFWPTLTLFVVCATAGYFVGTLPEQWQNMAVGIGAAALIVLLWLLPLASWLNRRYTITTRRVIFRHGFLVRTRQELLHSRGYGVTVKKSWVQSAFRTGDVYIDAGAEKPLVMRDVRNPDLVQDVLHDLMEDLPAPIRARRMGPRATEAYGGTPSAVSDESSFWNRG